jgi:hypothetical protein
MGEHYYGGPVAFAILPQKMFEISHITCISAKNEENGTL